MPSEVHDALALELIPVRPPDPPSRPTPTSPTQAAANFARLADAVYTSRRAQQTAIRARGGPPRPRSAAGVRRCAS